MKLQENHWSLGYIGANFFMLSAKKKLFEEIRISFFIKRKIESRSKKYIGKHKLQREDFIYVPWLLKKYFIYLFLEKGEGKEKERERNINVWLPLPHPRLGAWPGPQPRHVPWLGIESVTLWFTVWHSIHGTTPARAGVNFLNGVLHLWRWNLDFYWWEVLWLIF